MKKQSKGKMSKKALVLSLLNTIFIITLIISIILIIKWYVDSKNNKLLKEQLLEAVVDTNVDNEENKQTKTIDFEKLKQINDETVAWIKVYGTNIEYPVVQSKDNDFYLKRNFNKKYNSGGWIFADYKNKFDGTDKNIVIYGHNMKDNSMFGTLKNILKEEWYNKEENYIIGLITEQELRKYQVFSIYKIQNEDYYITTSFSDDEFIKFIETLKQRSIKDFNIEITAQDSLLTLSTCANNNKYRVVLHAKRINI